MAKLTVHNVKGEATGEIELSDAVFGITEINQDLFYEVVKAQLASRRAGTHQGKTRSAVAGSKKKIYKQKGTGNARHGDRKVNIFKGGGHGHSKKRTREDFRQTMPTKMRSSASVMIVLQQFADRFGQFGFGEGLAQEALGAFLERLDRGRLVGQSRDDQDADPGVEAAQLADAFEAVHLRHRQVHRHQVRAHRLETGHRVAAVKPSGDSTTSPASVIPRR